MVEEYSKSGQFSYLRKAIDDLFAKVTELKREGKKSEANKL